jgi:hypothetical protein
MTLDDLKKPWMAETSPTGRAPKIGDLRSEVARVRRDVWMRDFWMIFPLVALAGGAVFFKWVADDVSSASARISVILNVACAAGVAFVLLGARRRVSSDNRTLRDRLGQEITMLERQIALLRNVGYWFILPMFLVIVVTSILGQHERIGSYLPGPLLWGLYVGYAAASLLAYKLCQRDAERRLRPLLSRLRTLRDDLVGSGADNR